jgi:hypothetical protein
MCTFDTPPPQVLADSPFDETWILNVKCWNLIPVYIYILQSNPVETPKATVSRDFCVSRHTGTCIRPKQRDKKCSA